MPLHIGTQRVAKLYRGALSIARIYVGATKVFEADTGGAEPWEAILAAAMAAGAVAVWDPDNPNTWTLREDAGNFFYTEVADAFGNYPDLAQAIAANQPNQVTLSTGRKVLGRVGGSARQMPSATAFAANINQPNTVVAVARFGATSGAQALFDPLGAGGSTSGVRQFLRSSGTAHQIFAGTVIGGGTLDTDFHIWHGNFSGASSQLFIDGVSVVTGNAGANPLGAAGVMARSSLSEPMADGGRVGPVILFNALKSPAALADLYAAINAHYPIGEAS
jgi:hypothetical protein